MDLLHDFVKTKHFYDDLNFPQGFNRSGHFTIQETQLLSAIDKRLFQLEHKLAERQTRLESLWHKYKTATKSRHFHTLSSSITPDIDNTFNELKGNY